MSEPFPALTGENLASWQALREAVRLSEGFSLLVAVVDSNSGLTQLANLLRGEGLSGAIVSDPNLDVVEQIAEGLGGSSPALGIVVTGFESFALARPELELAIEHVNWSRPRWSKRFPFPIVLLIPRDLVSVFAQAAPDFWRFRSLLVEFQFGHSEADERIDELRRRLRDIRMSPQYKDRTLRELATLTSFATEPDVQPDAP